MSGFPTEMRCTNCGGSKFQCEELVPRVVRVTEITPKKILLDTAYEEIHCEKVHKRILRCTVCDRSWIVSDKIVVDYS